MNCCGVDETLPEGSPPFNVEIEKAKIMTVGVNIFPPKITLGELKFTS
jgi:hypothetical protein